jgi:predicted RecA/RadA family phage recombinase
MTSKYITEGNVVDYVSGSAVTNGQVLIVGTKIGVALAALAAAGTVSVQIAGVFNIAKLSTDNITQGANVYWDNTNSRMTLTSAGNTLAGVAYAAAAAATTSVQVLLNGVSC